MTTMELDGELAIALPVFVLGALSTAGIVTEIVFLDFTQVLWSGSGVVLSLGSLMCIVALAGVYANRNTPLRNSMGIMEAWIVYVTVGLVLAPPFFPHIAEFVGTEIVAFPAVLLQTGGFVMVSYLN